MLSEELIRNTLKNVRYPGFSRDIVSFGLLKKVTINAETTSAEVTLNIATRDPKIADQIKRDSQAALETLPQEATVNLVVNIEEPKHNITASGQAGKASIPGVKRILAIASGKGGVGKSTVAANLAVALSKQGQNVGLCDCDLYGPSVAQIFGSTQRPQTTAEDQILPVEAHGIKFISMGLLLDESSPVIVRGPLATRYTQQFLRGVDWGNLDTLILDLPPGTGDIQLTIVQTVAVDGGIIVTTPQEMSLIDARKAASMFKKVNVPIAGIVENMSWFTCDQGVRYSLFGEGGGQKEADRLNLPLLAQIPLEPQAGRLADQGIPVATLPASESQTSAIMQALAKQLTPQEA